jgi:hypothetical protein
VEEFFLRPRKGKMLFIKLKLFSTPGQKIPATCDSKPIDPLSSETFAKSFFKLLTLLPEQSVKGDNTFESNFKTYDMKKVTITLAAFLLATSLTVAQEPQKTERKIEKKENEVKQEAKQDAKKAEKKMERAEDKAEREADKTARKTKKEAKKVEKKAEKAADKAEKKADNAVQKADEKTDQ